MAEPSGRDLLREWRRLMEGVVSSAVSATGRRDLAADLLGAMQHQLELVQEVLDGERRWQGELAGRLLAPLDAGFDLLEQTASTLRQQAEALQSAGRALEESAGLMKSQAELFERTIGVLREPAEMARQAAGLERRGAKPRKRAPRK
jgi:hypothetical protein